MSNELGFPKTRILVPEDLPDNIKMEMVETWKKKHMSPKHKKRLAKQLKKAEKERDESRKKVLGH